MTAIITGKRRFTCLTPRLVRIEFSPTGVFEDRRSMVAFTRPDPMPFERVEEQDDRLTLQIGGLNIISTENDRDLFPFNMRIDFKMGDHTQTWRFGDRDYRNLGGAVRSLDYYGRDSLLNGVHPASTSSPDDFFHVDAELFDTAQVYVMDGHFDWQMEIMRQGLHGTLRSSPHMVYNRYINMIGDLTRFQPGLLSRNGYFLLNDSNGAVLDENGFPSERNTPGTRDLYFFAYGTDYKSALADYRLLGGAIPLPAKNVFGILFSRWPAFSEPEARAIVDRFEQENLPLSALILDLEWHIPDWSHWDWNPETYPQPEFFLQWAHRKNLLVGLNVHPQNIFSTDSHFEPFVKASGAEKKVKSIWENPVVAMTVKSGADRMVSPDLANPVEARAQEEICCDPIIRQGVDYWWLDGASAQINGADGQLISSKVFYETTTTNNLRGMVQARYGGIGSHRYGMLFTGDTNSQWEVLQSECEFNIRAGQVGMAYVSHDIGGFSHSEAPIIDSDLYIRWLQFGVFNPVLRFHSAPGSGSRQPWDYGEKNLDIAKRWLKLRHSLLPYIYAAARQAYETGLPLARGLYIDHPNLESCYRFDEYLFGESLLVAPILTPSNHRTVTLPDGKWYDFETGKLLEGGRDINVYAGLEQVPLYVKAGAILLRQGETVLPAQAFINDLLLDVYPGADGKATLYEDDCRTRAYEQNEFGLTRYTVREADGTIIMNGGETKGKCFGDERRIQVRVIIVSSPTKVLLNGTELSGEKMKFDSTSQRVTIDLGMIPVNQSWEIIIRK
jgi:alpha-glucosidase (family GH31 glycosyl hydrolase)